MKVKYRFTEIVTYSGEVEMEEDEFNKLKNSKELVLYDELSSFTDPHDGYNHNLGSIEVFEEVI